MAPVALSEEDQATPRDALEQMRRRRNIVAAVLVGVLVLLAWHHRWTFDDGFINFRIVKQLEAGHGPVFNSGQRVEVFTSPLWLFVLAFVDVLTPIRLEWLSVFLGIAFTALGLASAIIASRRLWSGIDERAIEVPIGALAIVVTAPIWYFATSGLEGGLTFAWLGTSLWALAAWATGSGKMSRWAWILVGLGWLVRPELVLFTLAAAVAVVVAERSERSLVRRVVSTGWAFLVPFAYEVFRMGYYASVLPNTAYAKVATGVRWDRGWVYFTQFVDNYKLWLVALCLIVAGYIPLVLRLAREDARRFAVVIAWFAGTVLTTVYIIRIGGDYIDARLLLPSFFAFCAPVAITRIAAAPRAIASVVLAGWALMAAASYRPPSPYRSFFGGKSQNVVTLADVFQGTAGRDLRNLQRSDFSLDGRPILLERNPALPEHSVALSGIGALGYALGNDVYVLDLGGLADPVIARFELPSRTLPGHEKFEPPVWAAAMLLAPDARATAPPFTVSRPFIRSLIPPTTGSTFQLQVDEARRALHCGDLLRLQNALKGPLTIGRFTSNIVHSFSYSRLTVPPDPAKAELKFCTSGR